MKHQKKIIGTAVHKMTNGLPCSALNGKLQTTKSSYSYRPGSTRTVSISSDAK